MMSSNNRGVSSPLSEALKFFDYIIKEHEQAVEDQQKMDALTQDYLHSLELGNLKYKERARLATKLQACRRERRQHKDIAEATEPLTTLLNSDKGKQFINQMREVLGKTRRIENKQNNRMYFPRVLGVEETPSDNNK